MPRLRAPGTKDRQYCAPCAVPPLLGRKGRTGQPGAACSTVWAHPVQAGQCGSAVSLLSITVNVEQQRKGLLEELRLVVTWGPVCWLCECSHVSLSVFNSEREKPMSES